MPGEVHGRQTVAGQSFVSSILLYLFLSAALLMPCFWHSHIQAGDLSSHIYNSWLAQLAERGDAPALEVVSQPSNVLFDLLLYKLFRAYGPEAAQRIAVAISVLIFAGGAFCFVSVVNRRRPWFLLPCLAMLTYGWAFHMGLFNFYLALGISWWALALLWRGGLVRWLLATPLLALAFAGHPLPPLWTVAIGAYVEVSRRLPRERQSALLRIAVALLIAAHIAVRLTINSEWLPQQLSLISGVNQVYLFGGPFVVVQFALLAAWGWLAWQRARSERWRELLWSLPVQLVLLSAMAVALIPQRVGLLVYVAHRASLLVAVLMCAALAQVRARTWERVSLGTIAAAFFVMLYLNTAIVDRLDHQVSALVRTLPAKSRVIGVGPLTHLVDRACIDHCYSYANYEPSTGAFRVRVRGRNPIVVEDYGVSMQMQAGTYRPKPDDPPWFQITRCGKELCVVEMGAKQAP